MAAPPERADGTDVESESVGRDAIRRALARLPRQQRAVVVLRFVEDQSVEQTAALLGCATGTVKAHTARALATLRRDQALGLTREGVEQRDGGQSQVQSFVPPGAVGAVLCGYSRGMVPDDSGQLVVIERAQPPRTLPSPDELVSALNALTPVEPEIHASTAPW